MMRPVAMPTVTLPVDNFVIILLCAFLLGVGLICFFWIGFNEKHAHLTQEQIDSACKIAVPQFETLADDVQDKLRDRATRWRRAWMDADELTRKGGI